MVSFFNLCILVPFLLPLLPVHCHDHVIDGCHDDVSIHVTTNGRHNNNNGDCVQGRVGKSGPKGERGLAGPKGGEGEKGVRGDIGPQGTKGERGMRGLDADTCECITNQQLLSKIEYLEDITKVITAKTCQNILEINPSSASGAYNIYPSLDDKMQVYCDMETDNGGWIVIQRRQDGSEDFYRNWQDYVDGFGDVNGEYWLGLEKIHKLTANNDFEVRFDLQDFEDNQRFAKYSTFTVGPADGYILSIGGYTGDAGDNFNTRHNGHPFSTKDRDQDSYSSNCAVAYKGGWWYDKCHRVNLNGLYLNGQHESYANGINWHAWRGYHYSLKATEMKIRKK